MTEHRNFWERLFKKTTKEVFEKNKDGKIIGKTTYQYDKKGGLIGYTESSYDEAAKRFLKQKEKTYKRTSSGRYESDQTIYFDDRERPIKQKNYSRDTTGMLFCEQKKYTYAQNGQQLETERSRFDYNGGLWTTITKTESKYDDYDHLIQQKDWEDSGTRQGLICRKSKSYVRNSEGNYDPKETVYRDRQGLITKSKVYERRQTEWADTPLLFCEQKKYTYGQNGQQLETERLRAEYNGGLWTTFSKTESKYDDYDHLIQQKDWEDCGTKQGLICRKSKSYVRNSEGDYDPKETVYRNRQGLITKSKVYERRQTELADTPLLFGKEENFTYPDGEKKVESHRELFYFMRQWLTMDTYQELVQAAQKLKQDKISQLETELARLKGEQTAGKQQSLKQLKDNTGR